MMAVPLRRFRVSGRRSRPSAQRRRPLGLVLLAVALLGATADIAPCRQDEGRQDEGQQDEGRQEDRALRVGTREVPPFAFRGEAGAWSGLSVALWQRVAADLGREYGFRAYPLDELLDRAAAGEIDVVVGAVTVTAAREERMDFSQPFFTSGLGVAVRSEHDGGWPGFVYRVLVVPLAGLFATVGTTVLLAGVLMWLVERRGNREQFGGGAIRGIGHGVWWAAVTVTTVGYGDKAPRTLPGRVVAIAWMFVGVVLISLFTAAVASQLTTEQQEVPIRDAGDLVGLRTAAVAGSTGAEFLQDNGVPWRPFADPGAALAALAADEIDAVVYDRPVLRQLVLQTHDGRLHVPPLLLNREDYAFALPPGSRLREPIDRSLLRWTRDPWWDGVVRRYLGR